MKLDTDMRRMVKEKKAVYPTKHSMNLYFKVDRTAAPATAALYILFCVVVLLALAKLLVYDPWYEVRQLETQVAVADAENQAMMAELADYNRVQQDYVRSVRTDQEDAQTDPTALLDLIDEVVRPTAEITQVTIVDHQVLLTFSGVTLSQAAELVAQLEKSPLVEHIAVDTATSTEGRQELSDIQVYMQLAGEAVTEP